jgi:hypothetical protein
MVLRFHRKSGSSRITGALGLRRGLEIVKVTALLNAGLLLLAT